MGVLESAHAFFGRAGEGALDVAEQFTFDQPRRDRRAIDPDHGPIPARAQVVDRARDQLLAGAGFSGDENCGGSTRHQADALQQLAERRAVAHHRIMVVLGFDLVKQVSVVLLQPAFELGELGDALFELGIEPQNLRFGLLQFGDVARRHPGSVGLAVLDDAVPRHQESPPVNRPFHLGVLPADAKAGAQALDLFRIGSRGDVRQARTDQLFGARPAKQAGGLVVTVGHIGIAIDQIDLFVFREIEGNGLFQVHAGNGFFPVRQQNRPDVAGCVGSASS